MRLKCGSKAKKTYVHITHTHILHVGYCIVYAALNLFVVAGC